MLFVGERELVKIMAFARSRVVDASTEQKQLATAYALHLREQAVRNAAMKDLTPAGRESALYVANKDFLLYENGPNKLSWGVNVDQAKKNFRVLNWNKGSPKKSAMQMCYESYYDAFYDAGMGKGGKQPMTALKYLDSVAEGTTSISVAKYHGMAKNDGGKKVLEKWKEAVKGDMDKLKSQLPVMEEEMKRLKEEMKRLTRAQIRKGKAHANVKKSLEVIPEVPFQDEEDIVEALADIRQSVLNKEVPKSERFSKTGASLTEEAGEAIGKGVEKALVKGYGKRVVARALGKLNIALDIVQGLEIVSEYLEFATECVANWLYECAGTSAVCYGLSNVYSAVSSGLHYFNKGYIPLDAVMGFVGDGVALWGKKLLAYGTSVVDLVTWKPMGTFSEAMTNEIGELVGIFGNMVMSEVHEKCKMDSHVDDVNKLDRGAVDGAMLSCAPPPDSDDLCDQVGADALLSGFCPTAEYMLHILGNKTLRAEFLEDQYGQKAQLIDFLGSMTKGVNVTQLRGSLANAAFDYGLCPQRPSPSRDITMCPRVEGTGNDYPLCPKAVKVRCEHAAAFDLTPIQSTHWSCPTPEEMVAFKETHNVSATMTRYDSGVCADDYFCRVEGTGEDYPLCPKAERKICGRFSGAGGIEQLTMLAGEQDCYDAGFLPFASEPACEGHVVACPTLDYLQHRGMVAAEVDTADCPRGPFDDAITCPCVGCEQGLCARSLTVSCEDASYYQLIKPEESVWTCPEPEQMEALFLNRTERTRAFAYAGNGLQTTAIENGVYDMGVSLWSSNGWFQATLQTDCNLVVYDYYERRNSGPLPHRMMHWESGVLKHKDKEVSFCTLELQGDGNIVVYMNHHRPIRDGCDKEVCDDNAMSDQDRYRLTVTDYGALQLKALMANGDERLRWEVGGGEEPGSKPREPGNFQCHAHYPCTVSRNHFYAGLEERQRKLLQVRDDAKLVVPEADVEKIKGEDLRLGEGWKIASPNGFVMAKRNGCDLVIESVWEPGKRLLWSALGDDKKDGGECFLQLQGDGNLVLYRDGKKEWAACDNGFCNDATSRDDGLYSLRMQDDGNLVMYLSEDSGYTARWSTGTILPNMVDAIDSTLVCTRMWKRPCRGHF